MKPIVDLPIDISAISEMICDRRYQLRCIKGINEPNPFTSFGSACHKIFALAKLGQPVDEVEIAKEFSVTGSLMQLMSIHQQWHYLDLATPIIDLEGKPVVEWKFAFNFCQVETPEVTYNIVLCGTIDLLIFDRHLRIIDYKTSHKRDKTEAKSEYVNSAQLLWYAYILSQFLADRFPSEIRDKLKSLAFTMEYLMVFNWTVPEFSYCTSLTLSESDIAFFNQQLPLLINNAIQIASLKHLAAPMGKLWKICHKCPFEGLCATKDPDRLLMIVNNMPSTPYNPLKHGEPKR